MPFDLKDAYNFDNAATPKRGGFSLEDAYGIKPKEPAPKTNDFQAGLTGTVTGIKEPEYGRLDKPGTKYDDRSWSDIGSRYISTVDATARRIGGGILESYGEGGDTAGVQKKIDAGMIDPELGRGQIQRRKDTLKLGREIGDAAEKDLKAANPNLDPYSLKGIAFNVANVMTQLVPAIAGTFATKSPGIGLEIMGGQVFGTEYADARDEGLSVKESNLQAGAYALLETLSELVPLGILTREGGQFLPRLFKAMGAEGLQESGVQVVQQSYEAKKLSDKEGIPFSEAWDRLGGFESVTYAGMIGSIAGGGLATATYPFTRDKDPGKEIFDLINKSTFDSDITREEALARMDPNRIFLDGNDDPGDPGAPPLAPLQPGDPESVIVQTLGPKLVMEGRGLLDEAIKESEVEDVLTAAGLPPLKSRVTVDMGDGRVLGGEIAGGYRTESPELGISGSGVRLSLDDGTVIDEMLDVLARRGVKITPELQQEITDAVQAGTQEPGAVPTQGAAGAAGQGAAAAGAGQEGQAGSQALLTPGVVPGSLLPPSAPASPPVGVQAGPGESAAAGAGARQEPPPLARHEGSWVVVKKGTLESVLETFEKKTAAAINREKYDVLTIGDYLGRLNKTLKEKGEAAVPGLVQPAAFDPDAYTGKLTRYVTKSKGQLTPEAIGKELGISPAEAQRVVAKLAADPKAPFKIGKSGKIRRKPKLGPLDIAQFVAARGGLLEDGETRARDWHKQTLISGFGALVRKGGVPADTMAEYAKESGYLDARDVNELYRKLDDTMGKRVRHFSNEREADYRDEIKGMAAEMDAKLSQQEEDEVLGLMVNNGMATDNAIEQVISGRVLAAEALAEDNGIPFDEGVPQAGPEQGAPPDAAAQSGQEGAAQAPPRSEGARPAPEGDNRVPAPSGRERFVGRVVAGAKRPKLAVIPARDGRTRYDPIIETAYYGEDVTNDDAGAAKLAALVEKTEEPKGWRDTEIEVEVDGEIEPALAGDVAASIYRRLSQAEAVLECLRT